MPQSERRPPVVTERGDGTDEADPVTLQVSGTWLITITATEGGGSGTATVEQTF